MSTQYQLRRGTTSECLLFTGAQGEIIVNTDTHAVIVQDGVTAGGYPMATQPQVSNGTFYYNEDVGSAADAYILVPKSTTNVPTGYIDGVQFGFVSAHPNTGPATANFQGLGVKPLKYPGGIDPLAGDISGRVYLIYDQANGWLEIQRRATGAPPQIRTVGASVAVSALTVTLAPCIIDFRSASIGSGTVATRNVVSTLSLTVPNGATLGAVNAVQARIAILALYGPSNVELGVINFAGGVNLDETGVVNTTAVSAVSNSNNVVYSAVARAGIPYRVVGFLDSTQPTAGIWSALPTTVQGAGGQALSSLSAFSGLGFGQLWTDLTASRAVNTTYTNSTGKPIQIAVSAVAGSSSTVFSVVVSGVTVFGVSGTNNLYQGSDRFSFIAPPGATYALNVVSSGTIAKWSELR